MQDLYHQQYDSLTHYDIWPCSREFRKQLAVLSLGLRNILQTDKLYEHALNPKSNSQRSRSVRRCRSSSTTPCSAFNESGTSFGRPGRMIVVLVTMGFEVW